MAKIAILHEVLGRSKGGIEAWIYHASEELARLGHEVVIFHTMGDNIPIDAAPIGVKTISLEIKKVKPSVFFVRSVLSYKKQLAELLDSYNHVWARSFGMAWAATQIVDNKVVYINAAPYSYYAYRSFGSLLIKARNAQDIGRAISSQLSYIVAWYFEKNAIKKSKNVYLSNKRKEQTLSFFNLKDTPGRFTVVPAGVDLKRFRPPSKLIEADKTLNLISVCRLDKMKNIQCVIKALRILVDEGYSINYTIIGDGEYKSDLIKLTEKEELTELVFFKGRQSNVEEWYQANQLFVLPSLYEGFGSVYIEAMSCGLPCIAISNKSGKYSVASDEIIDHELNGFLMKENFPRELADYIKKFIDDKKLLNVFGDVARETVLKRFTWKKSVDTILTL